MKKKNRKKNPRWNRSQWLFARMRPDYDLTDVLADLLADTPDYTQIAADLAGVSMVAVETGSYLVDGDDNGNDYDAE